MSQAIELAFDNRDLASISGDLSHGHNDAKKHKLKINSRQMITLEEGGDDSLMHQQNQLDDRLRDVNEGFDQLLQNQAHRNESIEQFMSNQMIDGKNEESQGSQNLIDEIQKFVRENQDMDSQKIVVTDAEKQAQQENLQAEESAHSSVQSVKSKLNKFLN